MGYLNVIKFTCSNQPPCMSIIAHVQPVWYVWYDHTKDRSHLREKRKRKPKRKRDTDKHKYKHTEVCTRINHNVVDIVDFLAFKLPHPRVMCRGNLLLPVLVFYMWKGRENACQTRKWKNRSYLRYISGSIARNTNAIKIDSARNWKKGFNLLGGQLRFRRALGSCSQYE